MIDHEERPDCWCAPRIVQVCPECTTGYTAHTDSDEHFLKIVSVEPSRADCWRCSGEGIVPKYDDEQSVIVIHCGDVVTV